MTTPITPTATIADALRFASNAQGIAADAVNAPINVKPETLTSGAQQANEAARMLLDLSPTYPRAADAREYALQGAAELSQAATAWMEEIPVDAAMANVKAHADRAFNHLEGALEILNNIDE
jgi:hypothetical protein